MLWFLNKNYMLKIVVLIPVLFLVSCGRLQKCELAVGKFDLGKPYSEKLDFNFCGVKPIYFQLEISGFLEGEILLQEYYKFKGMGKIDTLIAADFYANEFLFNYRPLGEVKGDLEFKVSLR